MPPIYPFHAWQFLQGKGDVSALVAPPYDVLDASGKQALQARNPRNIVTIDLPHTPAKELGPASAYEAAGATYRAWQADGTLTRRPAPTIFAYRQTFHTAGREVKRTGMCVCVDVVPFGKRDGGGILPHEETFSGPKEDRMALMRATRAQLSPIFGLHADERGLARECLDSIIRARRADMTAKTADGTLHEVWSVDDPGQIRTYQEALRNEDIFIADGHHRYTTGLNYLASLESAGAVPASHPARRSMMVVVGMSDPGLVIWPTHRVLGGMKGYSLDAFLAAARDILHVNPFGGALRDIEMELMSITAPAPGKQQNVIGLHDFASGRSFTASFARRDPLRARFPDQPQAWRDLDVALIQHLIVEEICQPRLNDAQPVKWAFPHTIPEVEAIGRGDETGAGGGSRFAQLAVIVRPTPLSAVRDVSRAGKLMPQKSTFFYPKLATGLWINALE